MAWTQDDAIAELQRANAELRRELSERDAALAQRDSDYDERIAHQAATVEVLKAMSASPGDPQPVYDLIAAQAVALCGGPAVGIFEFDGALIHCRVAIFRDSPPDLSATYIASFPRPADQEPKLALAIAIREERIVHIRDADVDGEISAAAVRSGFRSGIIVPLLRDGGAIGAMSLASTETGGYSDSQVELLQTFAEQAVIAITSAETYRALQARTADLQESLEYQTATGDVLKVISHSTFDLDPVLAAVAETAARLCDSDQAMISRYEDGVMWLGANFGFPPEYEAHVRSAGRMPVSDDSPSVSARTHREGGVVHVEDVAAIPGYPRVAVDLGKQRTSLGVPLLRDGQSIGCIVLARQRVEPFTERQIELVKTFADQAVIAIENTRLMTEQREALEQQTATAEVLQVINASPGDLAPVFQTMLDRALRLCGAAFGELSRIDGEITTTVAVSGMPAAFSQVRVGSQLRPGPGTASWRFRHGENLVHIADLVDTEAYRDGEPVRRALVDDGGARALLAVTLRKDDTLLGLISIFRQEPGAFTGKQIALLENFAAQAVIAMENARLLTETREALEQQTATAEVLQVINASPGDLAPVFDAILERAHRICRFDHGALALFDGTHFRSVATRGYGETGDAVTRVPYRPSGAQRLVLRGARYGHIPDVSAFSAEPDDTVFTDWIALSGFRATLLVPLRKDGVVIGHLSGWRLEAGPFSDKEIALLENFAAQAVIAMENARLLTETREALEQQTATAEVLQVINASPGDLTPVFDAMLEKAMRLCGAAFGLLSTWDGGNAHLVASRGLPSAYADRRTENAAAVDPHSALGRALDTRRPAQTLDLTDLQSYRNGHPGIRAIADLAGARTILQVPLVQDQAVTGFFTFYRTEVRAFSDKQVALLENFAAQAVIAMENARLLTEQREALEQQTATAEVLQVINASPGNLTPVFDAMLENALRLCRGTIGGIFTIEGNRSVTRALRGVTPAFAAFQERYPIDEIQPGTVPARIIDTRRPVQNPDVKAGETYRDGVPYARALVDLGNIRAVLAVPLLKDGVAAGMIALYREEPGAFTDKQIALLENFAAQAVIAMENARLLTEQREALERQTATAEVLQVINASPGNLQPVFHAMLEKAMGLCEASFGLLRTFDGESWQAAATINVPEAVQAHWRAPAKTSPGGAHERLVRGERVVHSDVTRSDEGYLSGFPSAVALVDVAGARTYLAVALRQDERLLGAITIYRQEVRPFTARQIALLENFADQAVIAMENARLLMEQREALERQTATAEVLQVINASPGDLAPVFDAVLEKALRLCGASMGGIYSYNGGQFEPSAFRGITPEFAAFDPRKPLTLNPGGILDTVLGTKRSVQESDLMDTDRYRTKNPYTRALVDLGGIRALLDVPLLKDGHVVGVITIFRAEPGAFFDKQVTLVEGFAAQAVIAMDNARLLTELRESLEQQTAMADVLRVINANPGNLTPVFNAILERAHRICGAHVGALGSYDGTTFRGLASFGYPERAEAILRDGFSPNPFHAPLFRGECAHVADTATHEWAPGTEFGRTFFEVAGLHAVLMVPLYKDGVLLGFISAASREPRSFTDKEITLLRNFAAQAVIAMDNARLLNEIRQRQSELDITFENMGDGVAMFDREQKLAAWNRNFQDILDLPDDAVRVGLPFADYIRGLAEKGEYGPDADADEQIARLSALLDQANRFERIRPNGRVIDIRQNPIPSGGFVIYADITERKRAEAEIAAARDGAEEAARTIEAAYRDLKAAQANLIQAEKMASLGQLTAGIAHEIKNPLNFVNNFAELSVDLLGELKEAIAPAETALNPDQRDEVDDVVATLTSNLQKITEHGKRADGIVKAMLEHSRGASGERRTVDINALADEALNLAYHGARAQDQRFNITLERDFGEGIAPIEVNPQDITRVLLNLFSNGFYAAIKRAQSDADGAFRPTLKLTTRAVGDAAEIRVRDNGTGIPEAIRDKLFQPFFTTKPTGEGTGLGLSITYDIITKAHGGTIAVDSEVDEFTEFVVTLPRRMLARGGSPG